MTRKGLLLAALALLVATTLVAVARAGGDGDDPAVRDTEAATTTTSRQVPIRNSVVTYTRENAAQLLDATPGDSGGLATSHLPPIQACERRLFATLPVQPLPTAYVVATFEGVAAYFLAYRDPDPLSTQRELWVVARADCRVLLFEQRGN